MILKLIRCRVPPGKMAAFSRAQEAWAALADAPGFVGQCGGFSATDGETAVVVAGWRSLDSYDHFMTTLHDEIYLPAGQGETYDAIDVNLFEVRSAFTSGTAFLPGRVLRIADCQVLGDRTVHFEEVQAGVWIPGMSATPGFGNGYFSVSRRDPQRYLVASSWADRAAHEGYMTGPFRSLREAARVELDVAGLEGDLIDLVPEWRVRPLPTG